MSIGIEDIREICNLITGIMDNYLEDDYLDKVYPWVIEDKICVVVYTKDKIVLIPFGTTYGEACDILDRIRQCTLDEKLYSLIVTERRCPIEEYILK